jgi:Ca2+-transporting ATPase
MADIGVAMGITGTDVAKEAAEMILTDDNFASIVNAIEEGRAVYDNIRRFVSYIFTSNTPELVPFILYVMLKIPLPLTIMQILAIDLGTDMVPALALGAEAPEPGVMQRKPRDRNERLLNRKTLSKAYLFLGPIQAAACMSAFYFMYLTNGWRPGMEMVATGLVYVTATAMTLGAVVTTQIGNGFAQRTNVESIFKVGFFSNRLLLWGILSECVVLVALVYIPFLQDVFHTGPLGLIDWVYLIALIPTLLIADEIRKYFVRRKLRRQAQSSILAS